MNYWFWHFLDFLDQFNASIQCGYCPYIVLVSFRNAAQGTAGEMIIRCECPNCGHKYTLKGLITQPSKT